MWSEIAESGVLWAIFGAIAWLIFYTRFYVQWLSSELRGRSHVPNVFWYQSAIGSLMLLIWAWRVQSPLGALSQSVNLVPYSRNLVLIWKEQGRANQWLYVGTHIVVAFVVGAALLVLAYTSWVEFERNQAAPPAEAREAWIWLGVGVLGQGLFAARTMVQWLVSERKKKSVVPAVYWYMSIVAASLQFLTFATRGGGEWLYAIGLAATIIIYGRNIWMIHKGRDRMVQPVTPESSNRDAAV